MKTTNSHYNKYLKDYSRRLRNESVSKAEKSLWKLVLSRRQVGPSFKRQRPIDNYIVDFFCAEINLIIEIDGSSHNQKSLKDQERQKELKNLGFHILRFKESEVLNNISEVKRIIQYAIYCLESSP